MVSLTIRIIIGMWMRGVLQNDIRSPEEQYWHFLVQHHIHLIADSTGVGAANQSLGIVDTKSMLSVTTNTSTDICNSYLGIISLS